MPSIAKPNFSAFPHMGYYVRILSTSAECAPFQALQEELAGKQATLTIGDGDEDSWEQLLLAHSDGREIACIERNEVCNTALGAEELQEFREELETAQPASAAQWLNEYFSKVRCIYGCQLLNGTDHLNGWEIFGTLKKALWNTAPGILQSDGEGFTNEEGYHILWQFSTNASGPWYMGVLSNETWHHFQMDLGNPRHRESFLKGEVPAGVKLA